MRGAPSTTRAAGPLYATTPSVSAAAAAAAAQRFGFGTGFGANGGLPGAAVDDTAAAAAGGCEAAALERSLDCCDCAVTAAFVATRFLALSFVSEAAHEGGEGA